MTQICYDLPNAAEKLNLSETILVRLSQYFKIPKAAYEEVGYLSFKGDLVFTEPDMAFFQHVKENLVAGSSLEQIRQQLQASETLPGVMPAQPISSKKPTNIVPVDITPAAGSALQEIEDPSAYHKVADQNFERYKSTHRTGLSRVFENMMKEVGQGASQKKKASAAQYKPMHRKLQDGNDTQTQSASQPDRILPFQRSKQSRMAGRLLPEKPLNETVTPSSIWAAQAQKTTQISWEKLIQDAQKHPRAMSPQLQQVAASLRQQATSTSHSYQH